MINSNNLTKLTKKLDILFVEDHDDLRTSTAEVLDSFFNSVQSCSNGEDALNQYLQYKEKNSKYYDIVLSDIKMPIMDGITLTREIYKINKDQPIIILSAFDDTKYLLELINLGIEQFIQKPIDFQELLSSLYNTAKKITLTQKEEESTTIKLDKSCFYNKNSKSLSIDKKDIYLTKFEIIFIELLISNIGKIYSNEDIVQHYAMLEENIDSTNIRKLVSKLRKKLPKNTIESIYGIGYKIVQSFNNE
jgi:DNA-binding response OmpR family regulator